MSNLNKWFRLMIATMSLLINISINFRRNQLNNEEKSLELRLKPSLKRLRFQHSDTNSQGVNELKTVNDKPLISCR